MRWPSWLTWYKKPEYRDIKEYAREVNSGKRQPSPDGRGKTAIPSRLKLDRVLENKTCSPMSLYDFHMYLKYIELSAENLEFYIWYKNYSKTWKKNGGDEQYDEKDYGSFHSGSESTVSIVKDEHHHHDHSMDGHSEYDADIEAAEEALNRITEYIGAPSKCATGRCDLPPPPRPVLKCATGRCDLPPPALNPKPSAGKLSTRTASSRDPLRPVASREGQALTQRAELDAVVRTFLLPGSEKELNIPPAMRDAALASLRKSSDPAHLKPVADHVYLLLKNCSHRNFVRLGVSNGTFETVCVATGLGIVLTCVGVLLSLLRATVPHVHAHSRWNAFAAWPFWWLGISLILSGLRGSCFFLLLFTRRQPLAWERVDEAGSVTEVKKGLWHRLSRLMIFDRRFKVKDEHLRRLQHKIVLQSLMGGAIFATLGVIFFFLLPVWSDDKY